MMSTNEIDIECEVNIEDIIAWNYYFLQNRAQWKRNLKLWRFVFMPIMALFFTIGIIAFLMSILMPRGEISEYSILLIIIGLGGFLFYLFYPNVIRGNLRKTINKMYVQGKSDDIGVHKYLISPEGVRGITGLSDGTVKWDAVENIVQTDKHLFILIHPNKAFIIPKRAFSDDSTFNQFAQDVKTMFKSSKTTG